MKIHDITAEISANLPAYANARPTISHPNRMENGDQYNLTLISASVHIGTHADMPLHFIHGGAACEEIAIDHFFGPAKVMPIAVDAHIRKADLLPLDIQEGDIILLETGQSKYMRQGSFKEDFIALTTEAAEYLAEKKIKTIGIDYLSVDPYDSTDYLVHKVLLGNNIAILEGLVLDNVPAGTYTLSALPLKIKGSEGSPVRAILIDSF